MTQAFAYALQLLLRLARGLVGLALMAGVVALALLLACGLLLWSLLRGKPPAQMLRAAAAGWSGAMRHRRRPGAGRTPPPARGRGEVVDVEAVEVDRRPGTALRPPIG